MRDDFTIVADMAAISRPRSGLAEKLAQACPECMRRLEDCECRPPAADAYAMREPWLYEMPDYKDLPPGAKVLTSSIGDQMLYVPDAQEDEPNWPLWLVGLTFLLGIAIGYAAHIWWG